ncbi:uncharacterized protein (DUF2236 family) [Luteibacter sp. Sphag1AF]|uniref:oxygenase MpaB family protein n=1 Tax=Luteibacter sp. Sphag1AF TaxID=2587031 RepID=UPI00161A4C25|nr:oxygenase MpaB family protein [Luteibacter sp. Sphag1AF]MBB3228315.1 uncharacterized protein (DUF2236 family) [Luteibacter sp. Sphag1AF]
MSSPFSFILGPASGQIRRWVLSAFPRDPDGGIDYDHPLGDAGLFGPQSVTWKIHGDFPGMLSGGLCALMLQTLHPQALAGVWDHSNFRDDLVGRLRRTTAFVGGTTYAATGDAQALIDRVLRIHAQVKGVTENNVPYAADDPDLLTWVHITEMSSFLSGYRRYCRDDLPPGAADAYFDETRRVAEALGARNVPRSEREVRDYFEAMVPRLAYTERSRIVLDVLSNITLPVPMAGLSRELFLGAGAALLPTWAADMLERTPRQRRGARVAAATLSGMAPLFRRALRDGVASRSCHRVGVSPEKLSHW